MSAPDSDNHSFPADPLEAGEGQVVPRPAEQASPAPERSSAEPSTADPRPAETAETRGSGAAEPVGLEAADSSGPTAEVEQGGGGPVPAREADAGIGTTPDVERREAVAPIGPGGPGSGAAGAVDAWPPDEALEAVELDDSGWTRRSLEAILLVADEPVPAPTLAELVGARLTEVEALLIELAGEYAGEGRGFVLRAVAGGWRLYTHPAVRDVVEAYLRAGQQSRLTRAALETLAVVAYRQPVTRHQVAAVRGVNVDGVFRTLATRGLIHEVGHEEGPGQAVLYGTTPAFLEQLGLNGLDQLPPIKDYLPEGVDLMELLEQM
jgi:segregation and condensation protein B